MSPPDPALLEALSPPELRDLVGTLVSEAAQLRADNAALHARAEAQQATIAALSAENQALRDEVTRLKGLPPRPRSRPSGMEQGPVAPGRARAASGRGAGGVPSATATR